MRITRSYGEIKFRRDVKIDCACCYKPLVRKISDFYTLNPFNTKSDAECRAECIADLNRQETRMRERGVVCRQCECTKEAERALAQLREGEDLRRPKSRFESMTGAEALDEIARMR